MFCTTHFLFPIPEFCLTCRGIDIPSNLEEDVPMTNTSQIPSTNTPVNDYGHPPYPPISIADLIPQPHRSISELLEQDLNSSQGNEMDICYEQPIDLGDDDPIEIASNEIPSVPLGGKPINRHSKWDLTYDPIIFDLPSSEDIDVPKSRAMDEVDEDTIIVCVPPPPPQLPEPEPEPKKRGRGRPRQGNKTLPGNVMTNELAKGAMTRAAALKSRNNEKATTPEKRKQEGTTKKNTQVPNEEPANKKRKTARDKSPVRSWLIRDEPRKVTRRTNSW